MERPLGAAPLGAHVQGVRAAQVPPAVVAAGGTTSRRLGDFPRRGDVLVGLKQVRISRVSRRASGPVLGWTCSGAAARSQSTSSLCL
jgi:hypothetical protein